MRADATASRAAIIDAAWQGFATYGPDISLRSIAQDAGVGIATLYRHFPTRDDLFIGVGEEMLARLTSVCNRYVDAPSWDEDPAGTWSDFIADFSARIKAGQTVAIVGPTGAGKTTIVKLLMRFYDVQGGSIRLSGHDVRDFDREDLRSAFGMVLQDAWLFNGTIRENIRDGRLDATDALPDATSSDIDSLTPCLTPGSPAATDRSPAFPSTSISHATRSADASPAPISPAPASSRITPGCGVWPE